MANAKKKRSPRVKLRCKTDQHGKLSCRPVKQTFTVTGFVDMNVYSEVEASSPMEALRIAHRKRGGLELNWVDSEWASSVKGLEVEDSKGNVLAVEDDLSDYMRKKYS